MNKALRRDKKKSEKHLEVNNFISPRLPVVQTYIETLDKPTTVSDPSQGIIVTDNPIFSSGAASQWTVTGDPRSVLGSITPEMRESIYQNKLAAYNYLMSTPLSQLKSEGYVVTTDNGSIFKIDPTTQQGTAYLPIQDIQEVENKLGTAGQLLLKFQQPELAKDTAGYAGGSSGTFSDRPPDNPVTPEVSVLPPVVKTEDGEIKFSDGVTGDIIPVSAGTNETVNQVVDALTPGVGKYWWLWYAAAAVAILLYLKFRR